MGYQGLRSQEIKVESKSRRCLVPALTALSVTCNRYHRNKPLSSTRITWPQKRIPGIQVCAWCIKPSMDSDNLFACYCTLPPGELIPNRQACFRIVSLSLSEPDLPVTSTFTNSKLKLRTRACWDSRPLESSMMWLLCHPRRCWTV